MAYLYYNETDGQIISMSPTEVSGMDEYSLLNIEDNVYQEFVDCIRRLGDYYVGYTLDEPTNPQLLNVNDIQTQTKNSFFTMFEEEVAEPDITATWDNRKFVFTINKELTNREKLLLKSHEMKLYITKKDDPTDLVYSFSLDNNLLLTGSVEYNTDMDLTDFDIWTRKIFKKYKLVRE